MDELDGAVYDLIYDTCGRRFDEATKAIDEEQLELERKLKGLIGNEAWSVYLELDELHGRQLSNQLAFAVQCVPKLRAELRELLA